MKKLAVCIGVNKYLMPGSNLEQCINDMNKTADRLELCGYSALRLPNSTYQRAVDSLKSTISKLEPGDYFAFSQSSHGSYEFDESGDEADGYDEVLCLSDRDLPDDELRQILSKIPIGVPATVILDSCMSGGMAKLKANDSRRIRFRPPLKPIPPGVKRKKAFLVDKDLKYVVLTGCEEDGYSYEDDSGGAFTNAFLNVIGSPDGPQITADDFVENVKKYLPSKDFPQKPQVVSSEENRTKFLPYYGQAQEEPPGEQPPDEEPDEPPAPDEPGSGIGCLTTIAGFVGVVLLIIYILMQ